MMGARAAELIKMKTWLCGEGGSAACCFPQSPPPCRSFRSARQLGHRWPLISLACTPHWQPVGSGVGDIRPQSNGSRSSPDLRLGSGRSREMKRLLGPLWTRGLNCGEHAKRPRARGWARGPKPGRQGG